MYIKKKLIKEINLSDNKDLLEELYRFLTLENEIQEPYQLSEEQQSAIAEARNQIKEGDYLTNDDANKEIDQWLDKLSGREEVKKILLKFSNTGRTNRATT